MGYVPLYMYSLRRATYTNNVHRVRDTFNGRYKRGVCGSQGIFVTCWRERALMLPRTGCMYIGLNSTPLCIPCVYISRQTLQCMRVHERGQRSGTDEGKQCVSGLPYTHASLKGIYI